MSSDQTFMEIPNSQMQSKSQLLDLLNSLPGHFQSDLFLDSYEVDMHNNLDTYNSDSIHDMDTRGDLEVGSSIYSDNFSSTRTINLMHKKTMSNSNDTSIDPIHVPNDASSINVESHSLLPDSNIKAISTPMDSLNSHRIHIEDDDSVLQNPIDDPLNHLHANDILLFDEDNDINLAEFITSTPANASIINSYFPEAKLLDLSNAESIHQDVFAKNTNVYIRLVEGFINPPKERQPGGRDNVKHALPVHSVKLLTDLLPSNVDVMDLTVTANVMGFDKDKANKLMLSPNIDERKFILQGNEYIARFDNLIVKFSSHLHGAKLLIRFILLDAKKHEICFIDAQPFSTITKRGIEKRKERGSKRKRNESDMETTEVKITQRMKVENVVESVEPPCGPCQGGLMARLKGESIFVTPMSRLAVRFGSILSPEIVSVNKNGIVCEIPPSPNPGVVKVSVDVFPDQNPIESKAFYKYINENNIAEVQELLQVMFRGRLQISSHNSDEVQTIISDFKNDVFISNRQNSSSNGNWKKYSAFTVPLLSADIFAQFMCGDYCDPSGFNILHHAAARGYSQLIEYLANRFINNIDPVDNFGRTPFLWSIYEGHYDTALMLFELGCDFSHHDCFNDNFLHIAARTEFVDSLEIVLYSLLQNDDPTLSATEKLLKLLLEENEKGETPISLSQNSDNLDMEEYLMKVLELCKSLTTCINSFSINEITLRSGEDNGKRLTDLEYSNIVLKLEGQQFTLMFNYKDTECKSIIPYSSVAFLILSTESSRMEFTLSNSPDIYQMVNGSWTIFTNHSHLANTLAFFISFHPEYIKRLLPQIQSISNLCEFLPGSFHYIPSDYQGEAKMESKMSFTLSKSVSEGKSPPNIKIKSKAHPIQKTSNRDHIRENIYDVANKQTTKPIS